MLNPGKVMTLNYPSSTLVGALAEFRRRHMEVISVRDLLSHPLLPEEYLRRPYTRRSRWLVRAFDLDKQQVRQIYLGSSLEHQSPGGLRLGLYEPGADRPGWSHPRLFMPLKSDRRLLAKLVVYADQMEREDLLLRIYSDDLSVVR
jgi:hypothetical protein